MTLNYHKSTKLYLNNGVIVKRTFSFLENFRMTRQTLKKRAILIEYYTK